MQQNHIYIQPEHTEIRGENTPHCHLTGASHHAFFVRLRLIFYRFQWNKRVTELPRTLFLIYFIQRLPFPFLLKRCHGLCFARHNLKKYFLPVVFRRLSALSTLVTLHLPAINTTTVDLSGIKSEANHECLSHVCVFVG